ncbi:hypothetical protein QJS04_geneDACA014640 [Acorus gramineus]|uniref:Transmembrane protein n=1 Tax=Acorus gramineus TaxID=55184 RepID=A0AAV9AS43_ACOGR|nr:hypothetical protein QJS04_geneDACA014640 [Acorus gramineus]
MTRGSCGGTNENGKDLMEGGCGGGEVEHSGFVLPKFFTSLSSKEKEEDFMAMKGCELPQRPKKRAKFIQKCLLSYWVSFFMVQLVTPCAWLSDLSHERYEVREKKCSRKRRRRLKAMNRESESE